jgi:hypothetical protein
MLNLIKLLIYFLLTNYICVAAFASIDGKIIFYSSLGRKSLLWIDNRGEVWEQSQRQGGTEDEATKIPNLPAIDQVRARDTKSLLVDVNQEIWVFGSLSHPSFGISSYQSTPQKIPGLAAKTVAIFENGTAGLLTDGAFFCWDCQAHHPDKLAELYNVPLKAVTNLREGFAILSEDNQVKYWGLKTPYQPYELQTLDQISQGAFASRTPVKSARK